MAQAIRGTNGNDQFVQNRLTNLDISTFNGNDTINLNRSDDLGGDNRVDAGKGNDTVMNAFEGGNIILLGKGNDVYFGTGFSSLSYLARLPFDTLKIDRSFVNTMKTEVSSEKIVRSILTLGRDLSLDVVAEGVEDLGLADRLAALGCQMGQGWGFAKALKPAEAEAFLANSLGYKADAISA